MSISSHIVKRQALQERWPVASNRVVKRLIVDADIEAQRIIIEAREQAAQITERAEAQTRSLRATSYREAREAALLELNQVLLDARERRDRAITEAERDIVQLSVKIAEKIIGHEIERDTRTLADIVSTALRHVRQQEILIVRVSPDDTNVVQTFRNQLDPQGRARFFDIVADPRVTHGGCIIESDSGAVDAQLATQLRVLEQALLERSGEET